MKMKTFLSALLVGVSAAFTFGIASPDTASAAEIKPIEDLLNRPHRIERENLNRHDIEEQHERYEKNRLERERYEKEREKHRKNPPVAQMKSRTISGQTHHR